eukprot:3817755-Amphidinium_carterae.1
MAISPSRNGPTSDSIDQHVEVQTVSVHKDKYKKLYCDTGMCFETLAPFPKLPSHTLRALSLSLSDRGRFSSDKFQLWPPLCGRARSI